MRVRSGQYVITAVVVERCGDAWMVRNPKSGRVFKVRRILEVVADGGDSPETLPASVAMPLRQKPGFGSFSRPSSSSQRVRFSPTMTG